MVLYLDRTSELSAQRRLVLTERLASLQQSGDRLSPAQGFNDVIVVTPSRPATSNCACNEICGAACTVRHNQAQRAVRIIRRRSNPGAQRQPAGDQTRAPHHGALRGRRY